MRRAVVAFTAIAVLGGAAWAIATRTESPGQAEARATPPEPVPVVSRLETGQLEPAISLTATSERERTLALTRRSQGEVVTALLAQPGDLVAAGTVLVRADGRPVFVLPGEFSFYRDLGGGDAGDDVAQLQTGLQAAGYSTGPDRPGEFRAGTKDALASMYAAAGVAPPNNDAAIREEIASLEEQLATSPDDRSLQAARTRAINGLGPRAVVTELATSPALPAVVETIAQVGNTLDDQSPLATLGAGEVVLTSTVPTSAASVIVEGATGSFTVPEGASNTATVRSVTSGESPDESIVTMTVATPIDAGLDVVIRIGNPAGGSGDQLLAPVAAIVTRGGRSYLYRHDGATFTEVEVEVSGTAGGVAAVAPTSPDVDLAAGTEVRVGVH